MPFDHIQTPSDLIEYVDWVMQSPMPTGQDGAPAMPPDLAALIGLGVEQNLQHWYRALIHQQITTAEFDQQWQIHYDNAKIDVGMIRDDPVRNLALYAYTIKYFETFKKFANGSAQQLTCARPA